MGNETDAACNFAGHKTLYGPLGVSGVILKRDMKIELPNPWGTGVDSANQDMKSFPERYEAGSHNILAISGLNSALKWIEKIGIENIHNKERFF